MKNTQNFQKIQENVKHNDNEKDQNKDKFRDEEYLKPKIPESIEDVEGLEYIEE